jgi:hypothetical protein
MAAQTKCLYYPFIHFQSVEWLKSALLYWEGVKRIVPFDGFQTDESPEVKRLEELGLVENVAGDRYRREAADAFLPRLQSLASSRGGRFEGTLARTGNRAADAHVHVEKIDERLADLLQASGLAHRAGDWFEVARPLAGLYMMALAGQASRALNAPMATDTLDCEVASLYFNTEGGGLTAAQDSMSFVRMICRFPAPQNLAAVSLGKILELRDRYREQRRDFRTEVQSVAEEVSRLKTSEAVKDAIEERRQAIADAAESQRRALDEANVASMWGFLSISIPSGLASMAAGIPPVLLPVIAGGIVALGAINWYAKRRGAFRSIRKSSPWHYLLSLEHDIQSAPFTDDFNRSMNQLVFD